MYSHIVKLEPIDNKDLIDKIKENKDTLLFYFTTLISSNVNYIYYPIFNYKSQTLVFTKAKNQDKKYEFIKPMNSSMIVKMLILKDSELWELINNLLKIFSGVYHQNEILIYNDIRAIKLKTMLAVLRKVNFDISKLEFSSNIFDTIYVKIEDNKDQIISFIERDITIAMVLKNINRIYKISPRTRKIKCVHTKDIKETYIDQAPYKLEINLQDNSYNILLDANVHLTAPKLYKQIKDDIEEYKIYFIKDEVQKVFSYFIRLVTKDFVLLSGYPNFKLFERFSK